jgi:hypothetical protein
MAAATADGTAATTAAATTSAAAATTTAAASGLGGAHQHGTGNKDDCCDARARFDHDTVSHIAHPN